MVKPSAGVAVRRGPTPNADTAFQYPILSERWREFDGRSWRATIIEQRDQIAGLLQASPGLKSLLDEAIASAYSAAVKLAHKETRLPLTTFPTVCPYGADQLLDDEFYPDATPAQDCTEGANT